MHSSRMCTTRSSSHRGGGGLSQCMLGYKPPLWVWAWRPPPRCGPGDPPRSDPSTSAAGCGPGNLQGMLGYHLQCMLGYHSPPVDRMTDMCKKHNLRKLRLRAVIMVTFDPPTCGQTRLKTQSSPISWRAVKITTAKSEPLIRNMI